ncbi:hypothetical protein PFICI_02483 [Pestalotiopsis fici W106-1]|uniref:Heterokaryon incompatibility domain-containing protein n=1 Tax=Pestalotiopsis fici (strain W106-1 / CGMCC3.15140) TaxID=1229662 RepID=W3XED0_PESFW|nr:uncharacterized protein PFICI_02483 [Pestalotiopsis fici W106-1]ETS84458.1 hypothetical protein PFICI_02483 [Pestalotiopsis fici W106-1]
MWLLSLLEDGQPLLTKFLDDIPPYAILSHTWGKNEEEVSFEDLRRKAPSTTKGYGHDKIQFCGKQAAADGLKYFWVDTCCIDKRSSAELQEAITSMYKWYQKAARCYVYLRDVKFDKHDPGAWKDSFRRSKWHTRGWTLQELLAPSSVEFFDVDCNRIGDKTSLIRLLHDITGIPMEALNGRPLSTFSIDERMLWTELRETTLKEDRAYCLLGIFGVSMSMRYGEGVEAMKRLRGKIQRPTFIGAPCKIPLGRNKAFVGRENLLRRLLQILPPSSEPQDCQRIAIEGLGGIGKTQIALEAAFQLHETYPDCAVFWVTAVTRATFENGYREIGRELDITDIDDDEADVNALVVSALNNRSSNWLLIIDNLDDMDMLAATDNNPALSNHLPFSTKGAILFTTRNHEVTVNLDVGLDQTITIEKMSESEAMKMLKEGLKARQTRDQYSTKVLLELLAHLPLAIKQAAAYMARTGMTTKQYLESYRRSDTSRITFLNRNFADRGRHQETANPISQTWLVSFDHIKKHHPLAARYLNLICFLAEEDIPLELFPEEDLETNQREEAIGVLLGYSFITERDDGDSFDIHRLVRLATRNSMEQTDADEYLTIIAEKLLQQYPYPERGNIYICMRYTPHVEAVLSSKGTNLDPECKEELLERLSNYTKLQKDDIALKMHQDELRLRQEELGPTHEDTLTSMHSLALLLAALGRHNQAQQILRHVTRLREEQIGPRHPDTLSSLDSLGNVLYDMRRYEEAEQIHRRSLYRRQLRFGIKHIETLYTMNNWALALGALGRHEEAEKVHRQEWHLCKELLGEGDPETLYSMNNLALMVMKLGQYETAEELLRDCLNLRRKELGPTHPDTLVTLNNLALVLGELEEFEEAESMHREELQLFRKIMGPKHPDILISMSNLAAVLERAGKDDEAEEIFQATERLRKEIESPTTPSNKSGTDMDVIISMYDDLEAEVKA